MLNRAVRRAHVARLKKARRFWWGRELSPKELGRVVRTPKSCSCWMCGNPRRAGGEEHVSVLRLRQRKLRDE